MAADSPSRSHQLGDGRLHPEGQLIVGNRRFETIVVAHAPEHALVERAEQLQLAALVGRRSARSRDVRHRRGARLEDRTLIGRRQESAVEAVDAAGRNQSRR